MVVNRVAENGRHKFWREACTKEREFTLGAVRAPRPPPLRSAEVPPAFQERRTPLAASRPAVHDDDELPPGASIPARSCWFPRGSPNFQINSSKGVLSSMGTGSWAASGGIRTSNSCVYGNPFRNQQSSFSLEAQRSLPQVKNLLRSTSLPHLPGTQIGGRMSHG
mmetsp:Transcript_105853/g.184083  ORF Transcript_105853/g.184083 Transcript_105853/m.184083 type:complete len:165 (-) Transcript_105853:47-541(-)